MSRAGQDQKSFGDEDIDEDLDDLIAPEEGHDRVYAVPRINTCLSSRFISLINLFAHLGGYNELLNIFENMELSENLTLTTIGYMITLFSMPCKLFHKDFLAEYAARFAAAMKRQILGAPDKILKDLSAGDVNQI